MYVCMYVCMYVDLLDDLYVYEDVCIILLYVCVCMYDLINALSLCMYVMYVYMAYCR